MFCCTQIWSQFCRERGVHFSFSLHTMAENVLRSPAPQGVRRARDPGWPSNVFSDFSEELAGQRVRTYSPSPDELKLQREERASRFGFSPGPALAPEPLDAVEATQQDSLGALHHPG